MKMELTSFVRQYSKAFPKDLCRDLIDLYEKKWDNLEHGVEYDTMDNELMKFNQIGLSNDNPLTKKALDIFLHVVEDYRMDHKYLRKPVSLEKLRIKKYPIDGYFKEHVDASSYDHCTRYLAMFVYLNDSGGTTFFGKTIKAETGKVVVFPPLWMFPHTGFVGDKPKYFLSTYLHYA